MINNRKVRLIQVAKEFKVGLNTIMDFLLKKGINVEGSPNSPVSPEVYAVLEKEFGSNRTITGNERENIRERISLKQTTVTLDEDRKQDKEDKEVIIKSNVINVKDEIPQPKILGKIDLEPKKKSAPAAQPAPEPQPKTEAAAAPAAEPPAAPAKPAAARTPYPLAAHQEVEVPAIHIDARVLTFLRKYDAAPDQLDTQALTDALLAAMQRGLRGEPGGLPMLPAYLAPGKHLPDTEGKRVAVVDAGGTHFRVATVRYEFGHPILENERYRHELLVFLWRNTNYLWAERNKPLR